MTFLITSDVHGDAGRLLKVIDTHKGIHHHLNAGDMCLNPAIYETYQVITVKGNNDFGIDLPWFRLIDLEGKKILLTHGHMEHVKLGLERLKVKAKAMAAEIVIFGHTHQRYLMHEDNILFINPGALGDRLHSYAIYEDGQVTFKQMQDRR